jgi:pimeloyl-ACP methyl ester carboxylesterase
LALAEGKIVATARLNGIDLHFEVHGEGAPLVLAHGYTASLEMWRDQVAPLSARYRLVIYDTRGHGKTTAPTSMDEYDMARHYAADLLALIDHLGIERGYAGGLSMGGMIAQELALRHPERVSALLLFDTGPGMSAMQRDPAVTQRFEQFRSMLNTVARTQGMAAVIDAMRNNGPWTMRAGDGPLPPAIQRHIDGMRSMSVDGYLGGALAMREWNGTLDRLHEIAAPTLVLVGERDNLLEPSRAIHSRIAGSRFVVLRNSGHGTNMWRPQAFTDATLDFLADVEAGRSVAGELTVE